MKIPRPPRAIVAFWRMLTETTVELPEPSRRRAHALAVFIVILIASLAFFWLVIISEAKEAHLGLYSALLAGAFLLFVFAFRLNRLGHYTAAASLLVATTLFGTWWAIYINFDLLDKDIGPIIFLIAPIVLCSFLLPARATLLVGILELIVLLGVSFSGHFEGSQSWASLVSYTIFISVLCIVSSFITRQDLRQIDQQNLLLQEREARLRELSVRDGLTGLFNRRYLEETLERELSRAAREEKTLGVVMVDLDYFKGFNDTYGHAAGDELLRHVAVWLQGHIRSSDIACRYGGDELTLILPNSSREVTRDRAEELRVSVKNALSEYAIQASHPVTISLGVAIFPDDGANGDEVLKAADDALYSAKNQGRDRVIVA